METGNILGITRLNILQNGSATAVMRFPKVAPRTR